MVLKYDCECVGPSGTVIVGAGVIGLSTAYHLALETQGETVAPAVRTCHPIYVVEAADRICPAASGQSTGGLGDFGFGTETAALGLLSYQIHQRLAEAFGGDRLYGYTPAKILRVTPNGFTGTPSPHDDWGPAPPVHKPLTELPDWIQPAADWSAELLADAEHAAHLDPARFCHFLYQKCRELGVHFAFNSNVTDVKMDHHRQCLSSVVVRQQEDPALATRVFCESLVIAAGPWSDRVFAGLFPHAKARIPLNSTEAAGNHLVIQNPRWRSSQEDGPGTQVFLSNVVAGDRGLDITAFANGTLYVAGWGAIPTAVPHCATEVHAQPSEIRAMIDTMKQYLSIPPGEELKVLDAGRCYRPYSNLDRPIIAKVDWLGLGIAPDGKGRTNRGLWKDARAPATSVGSRRGGVFVNTGHDSDGMTLGPGSGKVMSELIMGYETSVDISGLGLPQP